jgi:hypothetical protein
MQLAADANLASALKEGQKRYFGNVLKIDWARNNAFADPFSDMSANVDEWDLDRSLAGVLPDQLQTTEGYSTAKLTIKLTGNAPDGTPLWKVFSPFSGLSYGSGSALNIPMYLQTVVQSPLGVWNIDQFTGWIDSAVPDLASGTVTMVCFDGGGQLENAVTMNRWGADYYRRYSTYGDTAANTGEALEAGTIEAGWLVDSMLRRSGFYEGPPWHPQAVCAWTLRGSALPEVGTWNQITQWNWTNAWTFGIFRNLPHMGPACQTPGEIWSKTAGKYGPGFKGKYNLGNYAATGSRGITELDSNPQSATWYGADQYAGNNSNLVGVSGWFYVDTAQTNDPWTTTGFYLSAFHQNFSGSDQYPANVFLTIKHKTASAVLEVNNEGATKNWKWTIALGATGWHFYSGVVQFTSTQVRGSVWLDGVQVVNATNGGLAGALGTLAYTWIEGCTNTTYLNVEGQAQYIQWINSYDTPLANYLQPSSVPPTNPRQQAKVDLAGQRLIWLPNIENDAAGDVIQAITGADLGAFYFTEQGVATFDSRATIKSRQLAVNSAFDVTVDTASTLTPVSAYLSVANRIGYTAAVKLAAEYRTIYAASKADQFLTQVGKSPRWNVTVDNVQAYYCGPLPTLTFPQGYDPGLSPPTLYWQQYMQFYTASYYNNGVCLYIPGTRPSNGPPPPATGMFVYCLPGWFNIDNNSRHLRIAIGGGFTSATEVAVDDSTPFLLIGGIRLEDQPTVVESVSDATSIARYKERIFNLPADDYHQDILWLRSLGASVLADTKNPTVQFQDIEVVGDPRRQLQDVCRIIHQDAPGGQPGMTGASQAYGSVVGIKRKFTGGSKNAGQLTDVLTIRTFPG